MVRTELTLRLPNSPGALAGVCALLTDQRVNIIATSLDSGGRCRFIVDNPVRAIGVLREGHHTVTERDVVFVALSNGPGALAAVLKLVSDAGVNIDYVYAAAAEGAASAAVVIGVDDAPRAATAAGV